MSGDLLSLSIGIGITALGAASALGQVFWINEFHYDNTGPDTGEFIEIAVPAGFTQLSDVRLTLYNGSDGSPYGGSHWLDSFSAGQSVSGVTLYSKAIGGLQNGPDGFSLDVAGTVQQFISYEGSFVGQSGPATGLTSINAGFDEGESTPVGNSIGLTGSGAGAGNFSWAVAVASPGLVNVGQAVVPEPSEWLLASAGLLAVGAAVRAGRKRALRRGASQQVHKCSLQQGQV